MGIIIALILYIFFSNRVATGSFDKTAKVNFKF